MAMSFDAVSAITVLLLHSQLIKVCVAICSFVCIIIATCSELL